MRKFSVNMIYFNTKTQDYKKIPTKLTSFFFEGGGYMGTPTNPWTKSKTQVISLKYNINETA